MHYILSYTRNKESVVLNYIKKNKDSTVKPVLTTTFLKRPTVLNDHVVVLP